MDEDIIVRKVNLPLCVHGVTIPHPDGSYNIYLNAKYDVESQKKYLQHELGHIRNCDFDNFDDIALIEQRADDFKMTS